MDPVIKIKHTTKTILKKFFILTPFLLCVKQRLLLYIKKLFATQDMFNGSNKISPFEVISIINAFPFLSAPGFIK